MTLIPSVCGNEAVFVPDEGCTDCELALEQIEQLREDFEECCETNTADIEDLDRRVTAIAGSIGAPTTAQTAADMIDHDKIYVYTGTETGYVNGDWYYWDGTAWVDGGTYSAVGYNIDDTLTRQGYAADAKATGDAIYKYDDIQRIIKIDDPTTTMGDIVTTLNQVNSVGDHVFFDVASLNAGMYLCTIYLGSGYYRIADLVTGFEGTGFFSNSDLLIDIIQSGSQSTGKHYTMQWDMVNAQGTRLNDAASITTDTTNFGHFGSVNANYSNPFDDIYPWSGRKLCNIDIDLYRALTSSDDITDCVVAWEDDVNFDYNHQYGVWVYTPAFFGRSYVIGNYRYFDVTDENLPNNIAYKPSLVGRWLGADVTLTIDGVSKHCNLPTVGMPMANVTLANQHTYAKNYGASLIDIYTVDAVSMLFIVEYASMNLQTKLGSGVSSLYRQSSDTFTEASTGNVVHVTNANASTVIPGAIFDIGTSNGGTQVGRFYVVSTSVNGTTLDVTLNDSVTVTTSHMWSVHGLINVADSDIGSKSGYIGTNGRCNAYYRGQTFYANKYQYILGVYRQTGTGEVWVAAENDTDNYDALNTSVHIDTGVALTQTNGYIQTLGMCDQLSFAPFCTAVGGNTSNPVGDYCYVPALSTGNTILLLGGDSYDGGYCGWYGSWSAGSGYSNWYCGSCPRLMNP